MAKLLIFEGIERCGKGSMIDLLHDWHGFAKIQAENKQPDGIEFNQLGILYEGMHQFAASMYKCLGGSFLIDRFFISEFVYSKTFDRKSYMSFEYIQELCSDNEVIVFYLENNYTDYINRGPKNKVLLSSIQYYEMTLLFNEYINQIESKISNITIHKINTHDRSIKEIYKQVITKL